MNEHVSVKKLVPDPALRRGGNIMAVRVLEIVTIVGEVLLVAHILGGNGWFPFIQGGLRGNLNQNALDRWNPENPSQEVLFPRLSFGPNTNNYRNSTWWQRDASYLRLKSAELGYTIPKSLTNRAKINTLRIYVSGFNIFTWSKFDYWDPELGNGNGSAYPIQRNFNAGININL